MDKSREEKKERKNQTKFSQYLHVILEITYNMNSKHHSQSSRRHPLKRVRPDNENQGFLTSSNGRINKKFRHQSSDG